MVLPCAVMFDRIHSICLQFDLWLVTDTAVGPFGKGISLFNTRNWVASDIVVRLIAIILLVDAYSSSVSEEINRLLTACIL